MPRLISWMWTMKAVLTTFFSLQSQVASYLYRLLSAELMASQLLLLRNGAPRCMVRSR